MAAAIQRRRDAGGASAAATARQQTIELSECPLGKLQVSGLASAKNGSGRGRRTRNLAAWVTTLAAAKATAGSHARARQPRRRSTINDPTLTAPSTRSDPSHVRTRIAFVSHPVAVEWTTARSARSKSAARLRSRCNTMMSERVRIRMAAIRPVSAALKPYVKLTGRNRTPLPASHERGNSAQMCKLCRSEPRSGA